MPNSSPNFARNLGTQIRGNTFSGIKSQARKRHIPLGTKFLHTVVLFWGIIFGNYYRKLYSIRFLWELLNVM